MKQYITESDLRELNDMQKTKLRELWVPKVNDKAMARICKNEETDEYDEVAFTIGKVSLPEEDEDSDPKDIMFKFNPKDITLRSLQLLDEEFYEELENTDDIIEEDEMIYQVPTDNFDYITCLPLLSIGQMIEILDSKYLTTPEFVIKYSETSRIWTVENNARYMEFNAIELCDALWGAVKSIL